MLTHLFDQFVQGFGSMPGLLVYGAVGLWIGAENLGVPLPLELMLLFSGSLVAVGQLSIILALVTVVTASLAFAVVAYLIGRHAGSSTVLRLGRRFGLTQRRIDHIDSWLRQRGIVGVILARIVPGIRLFGAYVMGIADIPPATFAAGAAIGTVSYLSLWVVVGALLGSSYRIPLHYLDQLGLFGLALAVAVLAGVFVLHRHAGHQSLSRLAVRHAALQAAHAPDSPESPVPTSMLSTAASEPVWATMTSTTRRVLHDAGTLNRRVAADVGLRGSDLQAQSRRPWPSWLIAAVSGAWVELATLVLILSISAHRYATFPIDGGISAWVQQLRGTFWASLIYPSGDMQWYLPTTVAYIIIFITLLVLRLYGALLFTALSTAATDLINVVINTFVDRPRPHGIAIPTLSANLGQASFPSGHVAHTIGLYGFIFFLCVLALRASARPGLRPWLFAIQAVCMYFIVFVGVSRVLEGQHWPSDVAGGYLVGLTVLALVIVLYHLVAMRGGAGRAGVKSEQPVKAGVAASAAIS